MTDLRSSCDEIPVEFSSIYCRRVPTSTPMRNRTHNLRIRSTITLPTELRGRTEKVGDDLGGESRRRESKGTYECPAT